MSDDEVQVRAADPMDESALELLADRMADFPVSSWRTRGEIANTCLSLLRAATHRRGVDGTLLVAERERGHVLGCVLVSVQHDPWNGERYARMDALAVHHGAEGRGIAGTLLQAAEAWAREDGLRRFACDLFDTNWRAHQFCEQHGFRRDTVRFLKEL